MSDLDRLEAAFQKRMPEAHAMYVRARDARAKLMHEMQVALLATDSDSFRAAQYVEGNAVWITREWAYAQSVFMKFVDGYIPERFGP